MDFYVCCVMAGAWSEKAFGLVMKEDSIHAFPYLSLDIKSNDGLKKWICDLILSTNARCLGHATDHDRKVFQLFQSHHR